MTFYNDLSPFYDRMISFESRFTNEKKFFEPVFEKFPAKIILDGGCGSGYHSIILSSLGKQVTGFDPSEKMIELARKNSKNYNCEIDFYKTDFLNFPNIISGNFDAIYTLGNSFVHLTNLADISLALINFYRILKPGGYICIGIVNYDKVLNSGNLEISKKEKDGMVFHRYNTFNRETITFHVDISGKVNYHYETELYPLTSSEIISLSKNRGFNKIQLYGNMKLDAYESQKSENIVAFLFK